MDVVGHTLDGGTVFGNLGPEAGDITPNDGKGHQDKSQHNPLQIFNMKIDALRTVEFEQDDIDPVCKQSEEADI
jgi:hypothetical protein